MSSNTKKIIILILILIGLSALMSAFTAGFSLLRFGTFRTGVSRTLPADFSDIDIESRTADVHISETSGDSVKVEWNSTGPKTLSVKVRKDALVIKEKYRLPWFLRIGMRSGKTDIRIQLPKKNYGKLEIESDTGSITIPAGFSFTSAEIESDTGSISAGMKVSGDLNVETDTGRISLNDVSSGSLEVKSDTGAISLSRVTVSGVLGIHSDTGAVTLERCDADSLDIRTDTGSVKGTLLSDKVFSAKSDTGSVSVPDTVKGGPCTIRTDTGSIDIRIVH